MKIDMAILDQVAQQTKTLLNLSETIPEKMAAVLKKYWQYKPIIA